MHHNSILHLLNGGQLKEFSASRGIRQGVPLSPYIFILCSEILSKLIGKAERDGRVKGIRIGRFGPPVSHLMFAEDTFLFCQARREQVQALRECVEQYQEWSGQLVSRDKSGVTFSRNASKVIRSEILQTLGMSEMSGEESYLGNPLFL